MKFVNKIVYDEVMAILGLLPGPSEGSNDAVLAAVRMLRAIDELNQARGKKHQPQLQVGIGIASGPVSLGVLGSEHRKSLTVIGNHVNLASRLQGLAGPNQIAIDRSSYDAITDHREDFEKREVELKGFSAALEVYVLELECASQRLPPPENSRN